MTEQGSIRPPRPGWLVSGQYVALRLLLTAFLAALIYALGLLAGLKMPWLVAAMLAIVLQLPLAWLLLGRQRTAAAEAVAASAGRRRRTRDELQAALHGIDDDPDEDRTEERDERPDDRSQ